ncbi:hypothetical protein ACOMHN_055680 [Nucella lapillus]
MEPFELKLHQVTFEESGNPLQQGEGQTQPHLDSFSALVHYDADFEDKTGSENSVGQSNLQSFGFLRSGKDPHPGRSSSHTFSTTTTTTTCTGPQSTRVSSVLSSKSPLSSSSSSSKPSSLLPWERSNVGQGEENFLVNADDYYLGTSKPHLGKVSPEVAAAGLQTLAQVSINTSVVARHLRKVKGQKRRVAKTTLTSTALTTPITMPTESPAVASNSGGAVTSPASASSLEGKEELEGVGDSSFETVAEALRLQWSVIGNANVTPASPEEVARIVAEAEKRLRENSATPTTAGDPPGAHHTPSGDPNTFRDPNASSGIPSVGSLSSLSSLSSSATNDNGNTGVETPVACVSEPSASPHTAELIRIPAKSITKEVEKTSWFQSRDKAGAASQQSADSREESSRSGSSDAKPGGGEGLQFSSPLQQQTPPRLAPSPQPSSSSLQSSSSQQQPPFSSSQQPSPYASPVPSPLPMFNPNLVPLPQIGPLFPKKPGGIPYVPVVRSMEVGPSQGGGGGFEHLMREKLKLEGQLEVLQEEAQTTLQERAELQAQLASSQLKLKSGQLKVDDAEKATLRVELERLRATRLDHEREAVEVQQMLEEKLEELKAVTEDMYQSQDSVDKLQVRMKELRDDLQAKEVTIQALKSKIAELYVEVQTTLQSKMEADSEARTARNDLVSLVKAKEWYQEQLSTAHEVRAKLQSQLTHLQAQTVSQGSIVERLKLESGRLRQHLRESQERALREKEQLARHLEAIQQDMMEREAAFQEIQRERLMIEDTFNTQVTSAEEEKSRISNLHQLTSELERQLEQAYGNSKKRQEQIFALETEQMDLMKKGALVQETLLEKEQLLEEANQKLIEVESQLEVLQQTLVAKDSELMKLREDKAITEIALKAALQEKGSVDQALDILKGDMGKVEKSFKQMRQELGTRVTELETAQTRQKTTRDELDRVAHELDIKTRSVDSLTQSHQEQTAQIEQLRAEKSSAQQQVAVLKQQLEQAQNAQPADSSLTQTLQTELQETRTRLAQAENQLHISTAQLQQTLAASNQQLQETPPNEQLQAERDGLAQRLEEAEEEKQRLESEVESYVGDLRQATEEKQRLETELEMTRRKFELSSVQQQENINSELQKLMKELEAAHLHRQEVEQQLSRLQAEKGAEVAALQQQLQALQQRLQQETLQLQQLQQEQQQQQDTAAFNHQLALDLEKERGRIAGLQQSNSTLKEHMKQLEEALAGRESSLMELNAHLEGSIREREKEQQQYLRRIQELEVSLKKEKDGGRDLRKQIGSKITENKRLAKQHEAQKKDHGELQEEAERRQRETSRLQMELEGARQAVRDQQGELQALQGEKMAAEAELERVRRELVDNRDRNPVLLEQIQSLEWQVTQRSQEVQAAREQLALAEQRQTNEMDI